MKLIGFTIIGTVDNLDFYYMADTTVGPIIFRLSVAFRGPKKTRIYALDIFEGWPQTRKVIGQIENKPNEACYVITYLKENSDDKPEKDDVR